MSIMEVLTLLLVIFAALSYIDNHKKKQHPTVQSECYFFHLVFLLRAIGASIPITSKQIIHQGCLLGKWLFLYFRNFNHANHIPLHTDIQRGIVAHNMIEDKFSYRVVYYINENGKGTKHYIDTLYENLRKSQEEIIRENLSFSNRSVVMISKRIL